MMPYLHVQDFNTSFLVRFNGDNLHFENMHTKMYFLKRMQQQKHLKILKVQFQ